MNGKAVEPEGIPDRKTALIPIQVLILSRLSAITVAL